MARNISSTSRNGLLEWLRAYPAVGLSALGAGLLLLGIISHGVLW